MNILLKGIVLGPIEETMGETFEKAIATVDDIGQIEEISIAIITMINN